ncbi:MAG TPA: shikimate dehydrogenase [Verrucomicrobiae bacterium]
MFEPLPQTLSAATRYCAVYGHPVKHSASPAMQNAGIAALGLDWRYVAFDVSPENLREAIAGAKAMKFIGLNLTVPHKLLALDMVDVLDASARTWGAVNTIRFEARDAQGIWQPLHLLEEAPKEIRTHGFNTDADAIARSIREDLDLPLRGARVVLLGAGGAGRAAALKLAETGVSELHLVNRTQSKAEELAKEIRHRHSEVDVQVGYPKHEMELLVNATSLGLKSGDALPLDDRAFPFRNVDAVYDMIYRPAETPLLRAAREEGCRVANGLGMLLHQGAKALEIWAGRPAPVAVMRAALEQNVYGE